MIRIFPMLLLAGLFAGCQSVDPSPPQKAEAAPLSLADYQRQANRYNAAINLPRFETTPEAIGQSISNAIARANAAWTRLAHSIINKSLSPIPFTPWTTFPIEPG